MDSCHLQADPADVFGACFDEPQTAREEKGSWEDIRWGQPPAANFPGQETKVQGRRGFVRPVTPGSASPASPESPAPPAPSCMGPALPGPACLCGSTRRGRVWAVLSPPTDPRGAPCLLFRDTHPKVNRSHCPTGKRRDCQSWVKTVNIGAGEEPGLPAGLFPGQMTRTPREQDGKAPHVCG